MLLSRSQTMRPSRRLLLTAVGGLAASLLAQRNHRHFIRCRLGGLMDRNTQSKYQTTHPTGLS